MGHVAKSGWSGRGPTMERSGLSQPAPGMFLERCGEDLGFPILSQGLGHELLLGLRGQTADGWIAIEIGREGIAFGAGGDDV